MFKIIAIMFLGIASGYLLRRFAWTQRLGRPIIYTVAALLFSMGVAVGGNDTIMGNLSTLGWEALLLASACTLGSALMALLAYKLFFREKKG